MSLNVRKKQTENLVKLLHFNGAFQQHHTAEELFKVLVIDQFTLHVVATLLHTEELRRHGVTLVLAIDKDREAITDAPAIYFVRASAESTAQIVKDVESGLYKEVHVNYTPWAPRQLIESLAAGVVKSATATRIAKVFDQYLSFIALESGLFTLGLPDSYVQLNDNRAGDAEIQDAVTQVVDGLFSVCATLAAVPIIRCAPGGLAQHVAEALNAKLCDHLKARGGSLFSEGMSGLSGSMSRPLLCIFDRNFDLIPMVEQPFTYKALVHDCLGLRLNKVDMKAAAGAAPSAVPKPAVSIEIGEDDAFWEQNGHQEFGFVAAEVDTQLKKYQEVMASLTQHSGGSDNPDVDEATMIQNATKALMTTVKSLPELRVQKKKLDNHMNLLYALLNEIKTRSLDRYREVGQNLLSGNADFQTVLQTLQGAVGTAADKLRLGLLYLLVAEQLPGDAELSQMQTALEGAHADMDAFHYVKRMRRMNLTGSKSSAGGPAAPGMSQGNLLSLMDSSIVSGLAGQFSKQFTKLIGGARQALLVSAVASLMEGKPSSSSATGPVDDYLLFDPKAGGARGAATDTKGHFREAIVFVVGGGNYMERERLAQWALACTPARHIVYGATELLSGAEFCEQLGRLGKQSVGAALH